MSPGRPYERAPSDAGDATIEWRVRRLEEADKDRGPREEAWRTEVRLALAQMLTNQALTNQTLGHGNDRMDEIDAHLVNTDKDVSALQSGHAVMHAKVRSVVAGRHDPKAFWTAIGSAVVGGALVAWEFIKEHIK